MDPKQRSHIELAIQNARKLVSQLESLLPKAEPIEVSSEVANLVAERVANHICLGCLKPITSNQKNKRGNHAACYQTQRTRMLKGETTEAELVQTGKWTAEAKKPGRKAAIDIAAEALASDMIAREGLNTKNKKVADKKSDYRKDS